MSFDVWLIITPLVSSSISWYMTGFFPFVKHAVPDKLLDVLTKRSGEFGSDSNVVQTTRFRDVYYWPQNWELNIVCLFLRFWYLILELFRQSECFLRFSFYCCIMVVFNCLGLYNYIVLILLLLWTFQWFLNFNFLNIFFSFFFSSCFSNQLLNGIAVSVYGSVLWCKFVL